MDAPSSGERTWARPLAALLTEVRLRAVLPFLFVMGFGGIPGTVCADFDDTDVRWRVGAEAGLSTYVGPSESSPRLSELRKDVRQALRRFRRVVGYAVGVWVAWLPAMAAGFLWGVLVGAWDRAVWQQWRHGGMRAAAATLRLGLAVFLRLLRHPRAPGVGKLLVAAAVLYAGAPRDLLWDTRGLVGFVDDGAVLALAARSFLKMCPDALIETQARAVVRRDSMRRGRRQSIVRDERPESASEQRSA